MKDHFRGYQNLTIGKILLVNKIQQIYSHFLVLFLILRFHFPFIR